MSCIYLHFPIFFGFILSKFIYIVHRTRTQQNVKQGVKEICVKMLTLVSSTLTPNKHTHDNRILQTNVSHNHVKNPIRFVNVSFVKSKAHVDFRPMQVWGLMPLTPSSPLWALKQWWIEKIYISRRSIMKFFTFSLCILVRAVSLIEHNCISSKYIEWNLCKHN